MGSEIRIRALEVRLVSQRLRHAAALALVGWYLMVPPTYPDHLRANLDAPISKWEHYGSFDSAQDCESTVHFLHEQAKKFTRAQRVNPTTDEQSEAGQYMQGECIATDDPRLTR